MNYSIANPGLSTIHAIVYGQCLRLATEAGQMRGMIGTLCMGMQCCKNTGE